MIKLALAVCLIIALAVVGRGHAGMISAWTAHPAVVAEVGAPNGDGCCKGLAGLQRVATHCAADTILAEPVLPSAADRVLSSLQPTVSVLPEGHEPADPLQPPITLS